MHTDSSEEEDETAESKEGSVKEENEEGDPEFIEIQDQGEFE